MASPKEIIGALHSLESIESGTIARLLPAMEQSIAGPALREEPGIALLSAPLVMGAFHSLDASGREEVIAALKPAKPKTKNGGTK